MLRIVDSEDVMSVLDACVQGAEQTLEWTKRRQPGHVEYMNGYADGIKNARNFVRNEFEDDEFEDEDEEESEWVTSGTTPI